MEKNHVIKSFSIFDYNKCSSGQLHQQKITKTHLLKNLGIEITENQISQVYKIVQELEAIKSILQRREGYR